MHVFCNLEDLDDGELPLCDMTFEIVGKIFDEQAMTWRLDFQADATPHQPVGFSADIPIVGWDQQVDNQDGEAFYSFWGPVTLRSRGNESDRLLALLAEYYGCPPPSPQRSNWLGKLVQITDKLLAKGWKLSSQIDCLAVGIQSDPALIAEEPVRLKLFFDDGERDGHYAEIFLNIDVPSGYCALNEKDEAYRQEAVHWLSRPGHVKANPYKM